jgi:hypothetical protein
MRKRRFLSFIDARNGIIIPVLFYLSRKNEVAVDKYLRTELVYIYIYIYIYYIPCVERFKVYNLSISPYRVISLVELVVMS